MSRQRVAASRASFGATEKGLDVNTSIRCCLTMFRKTPLGCFVAFALSVAQTVLAQQSWPLWPEKPPGDKDPMPVEADITKTTDNLVAGKRLIRLGNVSEPSLTVYRPSGTHSNGTAVLVCPGGAYHILAMDLEGTEVCQWLNSLGVTAVLLKYRVPVRLNRPRHEAPLQDAQRAVSIIRTRASEWGIDPKRVGVLGFSAGGHLAATLSATSERTYEVVDQFDKVPVRPDFQILIYPAYLTQKDEPQKLAPEVAVTAATPPAIMVMSQDDPVKVENVLGYSLALRQAKVPFELHVYPNGGHGYGLRRTSQDVTSWPERVRDWMAAGGWLK